MAKRKIYPNLGDWFDKGEGKKLRRLLGKWLYDHSKNPCDTMAWRYVLVSQFRDELEGALGYPKAWLRYATIDRDHFEGDDDDDPRYAFPEKKAEDILDGVLEWTLSDYPPDILCMRDDISRREFLTALFWCTGHTDGYDGFDIG